jgi:hypothetical protein
LPSKISNQLNPKHHPYHHLKRADDRLRRRSIWWDIIIWVRELLPPEKIVVKYFQLFWKMEKVFQNAFF